MCEREKLRECACAPFTYLIVASVCLLSQFHHKMCLPLIIRLEPHSIELLDNLPSVDISSDCVVSVKQVHVGGSNGRIQFKDFAKEGGG